MFFFEDVTPVHPDCHPFVMTQRHDVFEDLRQALRIMNIVNDQTPIPNMLYAMWLLENKQLRQGTNINVSGVRCDILTTVRMCSFFFSFFAFFSLSCSMSHMD